MNIEFSIVVPAYNEEARIAFLLKDYLNFFEGKDFSWEIVVVVNNSIDKTEDIVKRFQKDFPYRIRLLVFQYATGKGGALIEGLSIAHGRYLAYVDADDSLPAQQCFLLYKKAKELGEDFVVVGSRWMKASKIIPSIPLARWIASRVYNFLVNLLFGLGLRDTQCAGKVFSRKVFNEIKDYLFIADMSFDVNLLYAAKKSGAKLCEVPVQWYNRSGSKVDVIRTGILMFLSLMRLRLYYSPFKFIVPIGEKIFAPLRMRWTGMRSSKYG